MKLIACSLATVSISSTILHAAEELPLKPESFVIEHTIEATAWPAQNPKLIPTVAKSWNQHKILSIAPHATAVTKGDVLVEFEAKDIDQKIADLSRSITGKSLALEQAEQDLAHLSATREIRLADLRTAATIAREENRYFNEIRRNAKSAEADQSLERAKQFLANQTEELRQLEKMYDADDVTEETEEIILTRQKFQVANATFELEMETLRRKRIQEVLLPREAMELSDAERDASIALQQAEQTLPRTIAIKKNEVASLAAALQQESDQLSDLEHDRMHLRVEAPDDGWFLHGILEDGQWRIEEPVTKSLIVGGRPSTAQPFATFIPKSSPMDLHAQVTPATARQLSTKCTGVALLPGREDLQSPLSVRSVSSTPGIDGRHSVLLKAEWLETPSIGSKILMRLVTYHREKAIVVPTKAVHFGPNGHFVHLKLADGKIENHNVKTGRIHGDRTEILSGLESGQVIILP